MLFRLLLPTLITPWGREGVPAPGTLLPGGYRLVLLGRVTGALALVGTRGFLHVEKGPQLVQKGPQLVEMAHITVSCLL